MDLGILKKIFIDLFRIDSFDIPQADILTVAHDIDRSFDYQGKFYSPIIDSIEDDLFKQFGIKCVSIARIISTIKGEASYANVYSPEGHFARAMVSKRVKGFFIRKGYPFSFAEEETWGKILDKVQPKKVIGILPSRELCSACHRRGIWVADVQHGVIAQNHPWYGKKFRQSDPKEWVPNAFYVWDDHTKAILQTWVPSIGVEVSVIGNPWVNRFIQKNPEDALVKEVLSSMGELLSVNGKKNILFSMSWGEEGIDNGVISQALLEVIKKTSNKYNWLFRLHPNQLNGFSKNEANRFYRFYKKELETHGTWEAASKFPLPAVLKETSLNISWMSSTAIEAAFMNVKTALLNPRLKKEFANDYFEAYREDGFVDYLDNDSNLIEEWIIKNVDLGNQGIKVSSDARSNYLALLSFLKKDL